MIAFVDGFSLALLGLPEAQRHAPLVRRIETELPQVFEAIRSNTALEEGRRLLDRISELTAKLGAGTAAAVYRFGATRAVDPHFSLRAAGLSARFRQRRSVRRRQQQRATCSPSPALVLMGTEVSSNVGFQCSLVGRVKVPVISRRFNRSVSILLVDSLYRRRRWIDERFWS
ncbi:hypothetical protein ACVWYH_005589 [Bradyrhizobium sp. GM24.11]